MGLLLTTTGDGLVSIVVGGGSTVTEAVRGQGRGAEVHARVVDAVVVGGDGYDCGGRARVITGGGFGRPLVTDADAGVFGGGIMGEYRGGGDRSRQRCFRHRRRPGRRSCSLGGKRW